MLDLFYSNCVLSACMYMHHMCDWCSQKTEDVGSPGTRVIIDGYELPFEC